MAIEKITIIHRIIQVLWKRTSFCSHETVLLQDLAFTTEHRTFSESYENICTITICFSSMIFVIELPKYLLWMKFVPFHHFRKLYFIAISGKK